MFPTGVQYIPLAKVLFQIDYVLKSAAVISVLLTGRLMNTLGIATSLSWLNMHLIL